MAKIRKYLVATSGVNEYIASYTAPVVKRGRLVFRQPLSRAPRAQFKDWRYWRDCGEVEEEPFR